MRRAGLARERLEQREVGAVERAAHAEPVDHQHRTHQPALARQRGEHRLARAEPPQVGGHRAAERLRRDDARRRVGDQRRELVGDARRERLHDLEVLGGADGDAAPVGVVARGQQTDLGDLAAERLERHREHAGDAGRHVRGARQRPARLVQELEVGALADLRGVGAVGEEDRERGREQQHGAHRVGADHGAGGEAEAGVGRRDGDRHADHRPQLARAHVVARQPHRRADEQHGHGRGEQHREERGRPHARAGIGDGAGDRVEQRGRDAGGDAELAEIEDELRARQVTLEGEHEARAHHPAEHDLAGRREQQAQRQRQLGERQRVRAAAEVHVHDRDLGERERHRQRPPGDVRARSAAPTAIRRADRAPGPRRRALRSAPRRPRHRASVGGAPRPHHQSTLDQREPDQRLPVQREPDQREPDQRLPLQREPDQREPDQRLPLQREPFRFSTANWLPTRTAQPASEAREGEALRHTARHSRAPRRRRRRRHRRPGARCRCREDGARRRAAEP